MRSGGPEGFAAAQKIRIKDLGEVFLADSAIAGELMYCL